MAIETVSLKLVGCAPLLMHNGQLADPLNAHAKALKALSSKRQKTDEIHEQIAETGWRGSLYTNDDGAPCIPADNVLACVIAGAKKHKGGPQAKAGVFIAQDSFPLIYDGPKTIEGMWKSGRFIDNRGVRVGQSRVIRSRVIFYVWELHPEITINTELVRQSDLTEWMQSAGLICGLGDYRPQFGRFRVA
jgi:hypothetical protein